MHIITNLYGGAAAGSRCRGMTSSAIIQIENISSGTAVSGDGVSMILLVTALKFEAEPLIRHFRLKKDMSVSAFPVFRNDSVALAVSGTGKVRSSMAAVMLLTMFASERKDTLLVNIGFCGSFSADNPPGRLYFIHKVSDMDTGRDYYPDIFPGLSLPGASAACYSHTVGAQETADSGSVLRSVLCDMESVGIMEASGRFLESQQVLILKIVSDILDPNIPDLSRLRVYLEDRIPEIEEAIRTSLDANRGCCGDLFSKESQTLKEISGSLRFTSAMTQQLEKEIRKAVLDGVDPIPLLREAGTYSVSEKTEGKKVFEHIRNELQKRAF